MSFLKKSKETTTILTYGLLLFGFSVALLVLFFKVEGRSVLMIFQSSAYNYFELLSDAFLNGRLNIIPKGEFIHDLSFYNGKYFLYWPPMPSIVLLPLVYLWGTELPSHFISLGFGALNLSLFLLMVRAFLRYFKLTMSDKLFLILGVFWAVGTVNFNVSFDGSVWYLSQVMSQTFILASFLFIFKSKPSYILSGLFFGMAVYTRNTMVFIGLVYLVLIFQINQYNIKKSIQSVLIFAAPFILFSLATLWYNFNRFDNMFDNGLTKHNMGWWFREDYEKYGYFNLHFFPKNFYFEILKPPTLIANPPFIGFDLEGFGMLWASPLFLLLPLAFTAFSSEKKIRQVAIASLIAVLPIFMLIMMIMGRGVQFGARYSLDYYILLFFALIYIFSKYNSQKYFKPLVVILTVISLAINIVGAYYMAIR